MTVQWTAEDAAYLRNIFSQPSGGRFLQMVRNGIPQITAKNMEEVGIEALKKQGAENLLAYIESLAELQPDLKEGVDYVNLAAEGD